jgi:hypothetical protein
MFGICDFEFVYIHATKIWHQTHDLHMNQLCTKVFFFPFAILWLSNNTSDHPQEKLAKLNYTGQEESRKY